MSASSSRNPDLSYRGKGRSFFEALVTAAWFEWRTGLASTTPDENGLSSLTPAADDYEVRPPGWFIRQEIGFAFEHGPSLQWTCSSLETANRRAITQLRNEAPDRVTYPRDFVDPRPRKRKTRGTHARRSASEPTVADVARGLPLSLQLDREIAALMARYAA